MKEKHQQIFYSSYGIGIIVFILVVLTIVVLAFNHINYDDTTHDEPLGESNVEKNQNSISIPGYEMLELKANTLKQELCMTNPPQNFCYFQLTLYLADGTLLWESELIAPGCNSEPIVLTQVLSKGVYHDSILRYSCYRMDETLTPLNGAETKLTLYVK